MLPETTWIVMLVVFLERTIEQAKLLLNNILTNDNDWTLPEPTPKPTPKKRGILFLSPGVATRPQTVKSLCLSVIPGSVC